MATITRVEATAEVTITLVRRETDQCVVNARSFDAEGREVRQLEGFDIYGQLSTARQAGITDLLTDVITRVKAGWEIA